ncbi:MAG: BCD family MFS transporter [Chloroflexota bacterium]
MRLLTRPAIGLLWLFSRIIEAIANPLQAWFVAHPEIKWWREVLRLGLIQFGVGLSIAPISGTLNRVLITELDVPAVAIGFLISLHYFVSPVRVMIGFRSDQARSNGTWRTPYVVLGVMLTFAGLALAPFALILLRGDGMLTFIPAMIVCTIIFAIYGAGINIVETIYLALVSDITPREQRGKVISVLWVMLILGTIVSAIIVSGLLVDYTHQRLIQVMQGSAMVFVVLTVIALWKQERLRPDGTIIELEENESENTRVRATLWESLRELTNQPLLKGLFVIIFIATMAFATHDVLLEPYGGDVLGMSVSETMWLTALWGVTTIIGVVSAGLMLWRKQPPALLIGLGCGVGLVGFGVITYASDTLLILPFQIGVGLISIGRGVFLVGSIILLMSLTDVNHAGLFLGLWGIVQAMAQGIGTIGGGLVRDIAEIQFNSTVLGYTTVYMTSLALLLSVVLILALRLGRHLTVSEIRLPWDNIDDIPADQLTF